MPTILNLANPDLRKQIAKHILTQIDLYAQTKYDTGPRDHLGASMIGDECSRKLWYSFHWIKHNIFSGRMQRLFQRGHLEELRYIEYLKGIGFKFETTQAKVSDVKGHFGGSCDGIVTFPENWNIPGRFLAEFKTKGTGRGFTELKEKGVSSKDKTHFVQQCVYAKKLELEPYSLYFSTNKNDDDMHVEFVALDFGLVDDSIRKAEKIIFSKTPPEKYSQSPTIFKCKYCEYAGVCHEGDRAIDKNCRSCINATPIESGMWACELHGSPIPKEVIKSGCGDWKSII